MRQRELGGTGLVVGEIGLGTEHLNGQDPKTFRDVIHYGLDRGVNYIDILFPYPDYRDSIGAAIRGHRDKLVIAGHVGNALEGSQSRKTHDPKECQPMLEDLLRRLGTDRVDVLMVQWVDGLEEFRGVVRDGGLADMGSRLKREGKARAVGLSTHTSEVVLEAAASGRFDVVMHPVNLASAPEFRESAGRVFTGAKPGVAVHAPASLAQMLEVCHRHGVALVAMKPFGGGPLLQKRWPIAVTPVQCLAFALAQPDIACVVAGVRTLEQMRDNLRYLEASEAEKDYRPVLGQFRDHLDGGCTYCNHCQPCPEEINVGETLRLLDMADILDMAQGGGFLVREEYEALHVKASACTSCGECSARCPFGVNVAEKMARAAKRFG